MRSLRFIPCVGGGVTAVRRNGYKYVRAQKCHLHFQEPSKNHGRARKIIQRMNNFKRKARDATTRNTWPETIGGGCRRRILLIAVTGVVSSPGIASVMSPVLVDVVNLKSP